MNNLDKVLDMFGVKVGVPFQIKEDTLNWFIIDDKGYGWYKNYKSLRAYLLIELITGEATVLVKWKPKLDEEYWYPNPAIPNAVDVSFWRNLDKDHAIRSNVGVYKTKEEALRRAKELGWR